MGSKVVAITGSYRRDGAIDQLVEAVLDGARQQGAHTEMIRLSEKHIEFCTNCRSCVQTTGAERGICPINDEMASVLDEIESADGVIFASPVNFYNATAIFRRFLERMLGCAFWPWGSMAPKSRSSWKPRRAVLIATAAMPGFLIPLATGVGRALQSAAKMAGATTIGTLWVGLVAKNQKPTLSPRTLARARSLGIRLA